MSKPCIRCGTQLPDAASFCPSCATPQTARERVCGPRLWRKKVLIVAGALMIVITAGLILYQPPAQQLEGVGQVVYQDGKDIYQITVCINPGETEQPWAATPEVSTTLDPAASFRYPAQLMIYRNGYDPDLQQEFLSKIASCTTIATPLDGGTPMECSVPAPHKDFPEAAMVSHITYYATSLRNQISWNILMQNGDSITLTHIIDARPLETVHIYPNEAPMQDSEQLNALLETIYQQVDPLTIVYLHLPPVTYQKPLHLDRRTVNLIGSSDIDGQTTFTKGIVINTREPSMVCIENIRFSGDGGLGIETHFGVGIKGCSFTGWDVGLYAGNGGSAGLDDCIFEENQIGFKFDTSHYSYFKGNFNGCLFSNNGIGFWSARLPGNNTLSFPQTIFRGNGVDVQNDSGHELDFSETVFE